MKTTKNLCVSIINWFLVAMPPIFNDNNSTINQGVFAKYICSTSQDCGFLKMPSKTKSSAHRENLKAYITEYEDNKENVRWSVRLVSGYHATDPYLWPPWQYTRPKFIYKVQLQSFQHCGFLNIAKEKQKLTLDFITTIASLDFLSKCIWMLAGKVFGYVCFSKNFVCKASCYCLVCPLTWLQISKSGKL